MKLEKAKNDRAAAHELSQLASRDPNSSCRLNWLGSNSALQWTAKPLTELGRQVSGGVAVQIPSAIALSGFIAWTLALLVLMELLRTRLVILDKSAPNEFLPDSTNLSLFMQGLARAHANCVESLPVFGGLLVVGLATTQTRITDKLAYVLLAARILQSSVHLASLSAAAVTVRFCLFAIQLTIGVYWTVQLLWALA